MYWVVGIIALLWLAYIASLIRKRRQTARRLAVYMEKARELKRKSEEAPKLSAKLKRLDEALEQLEKARSLSPKSSTIKELLAQWQQERKALTSGREKPNQS